LLRNIVSKFVSIDIIFQAIFYIKNTSKFIINQWSIPTLCLLYSEKNENTVFDETENRTGLFFCDLKKCMGEEQTVQFVVLTGG
jgi:hypothetical protein